MLSSSLIAVAALTFLVVIILFKAAVIVPQKSEFIVERLGKYHTTMGAGFHLLLPFFDRIAYKFSLKEEVLDIPSQTGITRDNVTVDIDGLIYLQVVDSKLSAYGISNYRLAATQLAQTTLRSCIGRIDLDKTFEERENINAQVVESIDSAAQSWGVKVLRYEVKDITPPESVKSAMIEQMTAERRKRAAILQSEGERQSAINISEGEKIRRINEAEGRSQEILRVAVATAAGLQKVSEQLRAPGGMEAANLRVAEQYVTEFGRLAKASNTLILPQNAGDIAGVVATALSTLERIREGSPGAQPPSDKEQVRTAGAGRSREEILLDEEYILKNHPELRPGKDKS